MLTLEQINLAIESLQELKDIYTDEYSSDLCKNKIELLDYLINQTKLLDRNDKQIIKRPNTSWSF